MHTKIRKLILKIPLEITIWFGFVLYMLFKSTCYVSKYECYYHVPVIVNIFLQEAWFASVMALIIGLTIAFVVPALFVFCRREITNSWAKWGILNRILGVEAYILVSYPYLFSLVVLFAADPSCNTDECADSYILAFGLLLIYEAFRTGIGFIILGLPVIVIPIAKLISRSKK